MKYECKFYEFYMTTSNGDGAVAPPPGDGWFFVDMSAVQHGIAKVLWAKEKPRR